MALNLENWSTVVAHEKRPSDVRIGAISAPASGAEVSGTAVTVTFTLKSNEVVVGSVAIYFTQDGGQTLTAATITGAVTGLTASAAGTSHSKTWNSVADLGSNDAYANVQIAVISDDVSGGGGSDDKPFLSAPFTVDNTPTACTITSPTAGSFEILAGLKAVEFTMGSDPGSDKLFPKIQADLTTDFDSSSLIEYDSQDGSSHTRFDHKIESATLKPIPGYYVRDVAISGSTAITFSALTDTFTGTAVPSSVTNARVIPISKEDRAVFVTAVSATGCTIQESAAGAAAAGILIDLFILDTPTTDFYVESSVAVTSTSPTAVTFSSMGNDDFAQDIPDTFGSAPRIIVVPQTDRMVILGTVTTTSVELSKSAAGGATDGSVTLFILKTNADIYQDSSEAITSTSLAARLFSALSDGGALSAYIPGAISCLIPTADRFAYIGETVGDQTTRAKSVAGAAADAAVQQDIWTINSSSFWQLMSPNGIPEDYEGEAARWRPQAGDYSEGTWQHRVGLGNAA